MNQLQAAGRGIGTGLGVALTPLAMAQAARSGRNPFSVLPNYQEPLNAVQQAQRATALAEITQTPQGRAFLLNQPEIAQGLGFPLTQEGQPTILPEGMGPTTFEAGLPQLPPQVTTPESALMESRQAESQYQNMLREAAANELGGQGAAGGGPRRLRLEGLGATGPSFKRPTPLKVMEGTLNPNTNQPFRAGEEFEGSQVILTPSPSRAKARTELSSQRIRSAGAFGFLDDLDKSVDKLFTATSLTGLPEQALTATIADYNGDPDAVNISTALGRLPVLVEALQRDGRISNQDASYLIGNLPSYRTDVKARAKSKLASIRRLLEARNINLEEELARLEGRESAAPPPPPSTLPPGGRPQRRKGQAAETSVSTATTTTGPTSTAPTTSTTIPAIEDVRSRVQSYLGRRPPIVARAKGGPVQRGQLGLVGEYGPELILGPAQVQPMPMQLALPGHESERSRMQQGTTTTTLPPPMPGVRSGEGLRPEDVPAAQQGGIIMYDPVLGRPVVVPR